MRSFNTYKSIFEDHAMNWINPDLLRGSQKYFGIRLAVGNVFGSDDGAATQSSKSSTVRIVWMFSR